MSKLKMCWTFVEKLLLKQTWKKKHITEQFLRKLHNLTVTQMMLLLIL